MAQRDFDMDELLKLQESIRATRRREQRERLADEKATLAGLIMRSRDQGLGNLLDVGHKSFYDAFETTAPIGNSLAFRARVKNRDVTIMRLNLDKSSASKGLFFEVSFNRLITHLGEMSPPEPELRALFPIQGNSSGPSGQWAKGYFSSEADLRKAGAAISKIWDDKVEKPMRDAVRDQSTAGPNLARGQGRYGGEDASDL